MPAPHVLFCIPVIARSLTADWSVVERCLDRTFGSLIAQTDPAWRAVVCGHEVPRLPNDPRIRGMAIDRPLDGDDKWAKITAILNDEPEDDAFLFALDADDLLVPQLVAHIRSEPADGWLITDGWSLDARTGALGRHGAPTPDHPKRAPFYKVCGSAGAVRRVKGDLKATRQMMVRHFDLPETAPRYGQTLRPIPFPAAAYLVAHGENQESRSGREGDKLRYIAANPVSPAEAAEARRLLNLPEGKLD
ncbi:hypothetical protein [Palleronia abyssalis]|uniref:Glycosyltransferase 2-like domain-containing protein n=1 Tax=Palleronia abyssalis TaxID=1501240 RepID=A0A2R8BXP2_9RHOB|nr:hypothetical protein [Palleronia abyssalis]SPJ24893.1 hypothetical protein PAA8504_02734 [Palleronia abyssalis]